MRASITSLLLLGLPLVLAQGICESGEYVLVPASNRPATRNCETKGKLLSPQVVETSPVDGLEECISLCKSAGSRESTCSSFGFTEGGDGTAMCTTYSKRLIDMKYRQRKTDLGTTFSNMLCYRCKQTDAPQCPLEGDVIKNGGFEDGREDGTNEPADWDVTVDYETDPTNFAERRLLPNDRGVVLAIQHTGEELGTATISQAVTCLQIARLYKLSFSISGQATRITASLGGVEVYNHECQEGQDDAYCGDGAIVTVDAVPTQTAETLTITVSGKSGLDLRLDNVSLTYTPETVKGK